MDLAYRAALFQQKKIIESWSHRTCHAAAIQPASPHLFPDTTTIKFDHDDHDYDGDDYDDYDDYDDGRDQDSDDDDEIFQIKIEKYFCRGDGGEACPTCGGAVFEAEKVIFLKSVFRKSTFGRFQHCQLSKLRQIRYNFRQLPLGSVFTSAIYVLQAGEREGSGLSPSLLRLLQMSPTSRGQTPGLKIMSQPNKESDLKMRRCIFWCLGVEMYF